MDYEEMRKTNFVNLGLISNNGGGVSFEQSGRIVLIGAHHDAAAVAEVQNDRKKISGSIVRFKDVLKVRGCVQPWDQDDFLGEINYSPMFLGVNYTVEFE